MPMIRETVVSTMNRAGQVHLAPIGTHRGRRRLDHRAVPPLGDARQFARGPICSGQFHRRRSCFCRMFDGARGAMAHGSMRGNFRSASGERARPRRACRHPHYGGRAEAALPLSRPAQCRSRAIPGIQPRQGSRDRGVNSREPLEHAAARQNRARDSLPGNRGQQDRLSG